MEGGFVIGNKLEATLARGGKLTFRGKAAPYAYTNSHQICHCLQCYNVTTMAVMQPNSYHCRQPTTAAEYLQTLAVEALPHILTGTPYTDCTQYITTTILYIHYHTTTHHHTTDLVTRFAEWAEQRRWHSAEGFCWACWLWRSPRHPGGQRSKPNVWLHDVMMLSHAHDKKSRAQIVAHFSVKERSRCNVNQTRKFPLFC